MIEERSDGHIILINETFFVELERSLFPRDKFFIRVDASTVTENVVHSVGLVPFKATRVKPRFVPSEQVKDDGSLLAVQTVRRREAEIFFSI